MIGDCPIHGYLFNFPKLPIFMNTPTQRMLATFLLACVCCISVNAQQPILSKQFISDFDLVLATGQQHNSVNSTPRHSGRTLAGVIYFTNNTPRNFDTFPVEVYTRNQKRRLAATKANAKGHFQLTGLKPGKYLLKFTWPPDRCTLWYKDRCDYRIKQQNTCDHGRSLLRA